MTGKLHKVWLRGTPDLEYNNTLQFRRVFNLKVIELTEEFSATLFALDGSNVDLAFIDDSWSEYYKANISITRFKFDSLVYFDAANINLTVTESLPKPVNLAFFADFVTPAPTNNNSIMFLGDFLNE